MGDHRRCCKERVSVYKEQSKRQTNREDCVCVCVCVCARARQWESKGERENYNERVRGMSRIRFSSFNFSPPFFDGEPGTCARACNPPGSSRGITQG